MTKWTVSRIEDNDADFESVTAMGISAFADSEINRYVRPAHLRRSDMNIEDRTALQRRRFKQTLTGIAVKATNEQGQIGAIAVWLQPDIAKPNEKPKLDVSGPPDPEVDLEAQARFRDWIAEQGIRTMGKQKHWDLVTLATRSKFQRQGAASALLAWGLQEAAKEGLPMMLGAVPSAVPVYLKSGFKVVETVYLEYEDKDEKGNIQGKRDIELHMMVKDIV